MNKPELYHKSHGVTKRDVGELLTQFASKLQWRPEGGDAVLEIGCGPGDISMKYIYPLMRENFGKLIFSDISWDMMNFFRENYEIPSKCDFRQLDIAGESFELPDDMVGQFDHVISSLVLHWVPDNRTALANMYKLLRSEGGDCLLIFFGYNSIFEANNLMSSNPKWSQYIQNANRFVAPLHYSTDPKGQFQQMMEAAGFCNISIELKAGVYNYGSFENFKENITPVCGVLDFITKSRQLEFFEDYFKAMAETAAKKQGLPLKDAMYTMVLDTIVVYGQKKSSL